jgi:hypothetical protein
VAVLAQAQALTLTPPGTTGFSQNYLVEVALEDIDAGAQVLSYYNSANPAQPFSGPANSGISQFTQRTCRAVIALKAGVPATTGTQTTPTADAGFIGLYSITVANGATQITTGNISQVASAPFFPTLPAIPGDIQQQQWVCAGTDTGTANNYVITFAPSLPPSAIPTAYVAGMKVSFKALNALNITLGLELIALRTTVHGNVAFGRAARARFNIDSAFATECMRVARAYGARAEVYRRLSWDALVTLSSPSMPAETRQRLESKVECGGRLGASEIRRARGPQPNGRPKSDQQRAAMAA